MKRLVAPFTMKRSANDDFRARKSTVSKAKRQARRNAELTELKPYRAVAIEAGDCACAAVEDVAGKRFLVSSGEVPALPVAGCDAARCTCKYLHQDDRRDGDAGDRRQWSSLRTDLFNVETANRNRRTKKRGRRKSD